MTTSVDLKFADGEYTFALGLEQINEIQTKCDVGIGKVYARILEGRQLDDLQKGHPAFAAFYLADIRETVRQGLVGGGKGAVDGQAVEVDSIRANELIDRYLAPMPLVAQWDLATAILYACFEGYVPEEPTEDAGPPGKKKAGAKAGSTTPKP